MIVLAIICILIVALFLYVRYKMAIFENRLELLSDTIQTMAGVTRAALQNEESDEESEDESDEESEDDTNGSSQSDASEIHVDYEGRFPTPERMTVSDDDVKKVSLPQPEVEEIEIKKIIELEVEPKLSDPEIVEESDVKTVALPTPFDSLTLKELKEKVNELNGPKLKTKKELIDFLQKKSNLSI